jgi:hypothetical protein
MGCQEPANPAQPSVEAAIPSISVLPKKLSFLIDSDAREKRTGVAGSGGAFAQECPDLAQEHAKMEQGSSIPAQEFQSARAI